MDHTHWWVESPLPEALPLDEQPTQPSLQQSLCRNIDYRMVGKAWLHLFFPEDSFHRRPRC